MDDPALRLFQTQTYNICNMENQLLQANVLVTTLRSENIDLKERHAQEMNLLQEELKVVRTRVQTLLIEKSEGTCRSCIRITTIDLVRSSYFLCKATCHISVVRLRLEPPKPY